METIPFENAIRTEWKTKDRIKLFQSMLTFFPQLTEDDKSQISNLIDDNNIDYFEVPHYENSKVSEDPKMILVFQGKRVFIDILDPVHESELIAKINKTIDSETQFIKSRDITTTEWKKRLQIMLQLTNKEDLDSDDEFENADDETLYKEDFFDDYDFSIPCDETGVLDRTGFKLIAKEPVLNWINETEKKQKSNLHQLTWTMEMVNSEPEVFLIPIGLDLESKQEQKRIWSKLRERAFYHFLESYYTDDDLWPEVTQKKFDEWFDIEQFGLIVDIAGDL